MYIPTKARVVWYAFLIKFANVQALRCFLDYFYPVLTNSVVLASEAAFRISCFDCLACSRLSPLPDGDARPALHEQQHPDDCA